MVDVDVNGPKERRRLDNRRNTETVLTLLKNTTKEKQMNERKAQRALTSGAQAAILVVPRFAPTLAPYVTRARGPGHALPLVAALAHEFAFVAFPLFRVVPRLAHTQAPACGWGADGVVRALLAVETPDRRGEMGRGRKTRH